MTTPTLCLDCQEPVFVAANGRVLTTKPTRLGIFDAADGEPLTRRALAEHVRDTGLAGHSQHVCPDPQGALFQPQEVAS